MQKLIYYFLILCIVSPFSCAQTNSFDQEQAFYYLVKQCDFGPRNPGSAGHQACLDYLVCELKKATNRVVEQPFQKQLPGTSQMITFTNVIASFGDQSQRLLFCAHWDTRPWADQDPDPGKHNTPIIGANDGASGVSVLLELARILHQNPAPVGVDIVLFDGEDAGLEGQWNSWCLGSQYFSSSGFLKDFPRYAVLLDLVGDRDLRFPVEYYSSQYAPEYVEMIWSRAEQLGLSVFDRSEGPAVIDDHLNLLKVGIPTVDIIDFDYPFWHTVEDTPDKCSAESLGAVGRLLISLIYEPE